MNDLPIGWTATKLGDLGVWSSGGTPSRKVSAYFGGSIPWIKTGDLRHQSIKQAEETITDAGLANSAAKVFPQGTLLVAMYGATIGQTGVLTFPAATNQACAALVAAGSTAKIIPYVWRYLIAEQDSLKSIGQGGAQPNISQTILKDYPVRIAPLREQRQIVAKIDSLSASSKRARDQLDHIPRLVEKYKQAILAAAFRGELTREWRASSGSKEDWQTTTIGAVITDICYGTSKKCGYDAGPVNVLRIPNVQKGFVVLDDLKSAEFGVNELRKLRLELGDILVIRSNGSLDLVGRSAVVEDGAVGMLFAGYLIRLRLDRRVVTPRFVQLSLQASETRAKIERLAKSTSGVNNINSSQIKTLPLLCPDIGEQHEIVRRIETAFAWIDRLAAEAASARKLIDHLDQAILAKAFRGELVPQDPNDEPAGALLERIRTERGAEQIKTPPKNGRPGRQKQS